MILVTGATGLSGSFVVRELRRRGLAVRALVREASRAAAQTLDAELAIGDLADPGSLRRACDGVDGIVHTAWSFTDSNVDIAAMEALVDGWRATPKPVRSPKTGPVYGGFVFFSSLDVYGLATASPIAEDTPLDPDYTDYARGKVVSERLLADAAHAVGRSDFSILRAPHIWAPHPKARQRLASLVQGDAVLVPGGDAAEWSQYRDAWIDARDLAWIVAECLAQPLDGPANALAGHFIWHDLFAELIRLTGSPARVVAKPWVEMTADERTDRRFYAQSWRYDDHRLRERLGFQPSGTWQQTLAETLASDG